MLEIRKPSNDFNRKSLNVHHGIKYFDEFMDCVKMNKDFSLRSPKTKKVLKKINARELWPKEFLRQGWQLVKIYLVFVLQNVLCLNIKEFALKVTTSNLCSEIMLHKVFDHKGKEMDRCLLSIFSQFGKMGRMEHTE